MRLLHLDVRGFGRLRGRIDLQVDAGLGLVLERNEAGKSTLASALLAALYGLDGDRRRFRGTITDLDRFRPWNEGPYGLSLTLERNGETLTVDRDFTQDTVRVLRGAEDVTDRYRRGHEIAVGEGITGLRKEQFMASVFVGQGDIVWTDPGKLTEALQRVADSQTGTSTAAAAIEALDLSLERYDGITMASGGKVTTEIKRCDERLEAARTELQELERRHDELDSTLGELESLRQEGASESSARRALRARRLRTEREALEGLLDDDDALRGRLESLRAEVEGWTEKDTRVLETRGRVEGLRRDLENAARDHAQIVDDLEAADATLVARTKELEAIGLREVPDDEDFDRLYEAVRRLKDAAREHEDFLARLDADRRELQGLGHDLSEALSLARDFEHLTDSDRVVLVGRTGRRTDRDERRRDLESARGHAHRDLDGVAASQDARRRSGMIVLGVALVAAVAVFILGEQVPVPLAAQFSVPAVLAVVGLFLSFSANGYRAGAHARALATVEAVGRDLEALEAEVSADDEAWLDLADRLDMDPDRIETRYAIWSKVESRARSAAVHRERADTWRDVRSEALRVCSPFEQIFGEAATEVAVDGWVERARRARELEVAVQHDRDERDRISARRQQIEAQRIVTEQALESELSALDLDVSSADTEAALASFDALVDAVRAREETREHRIPSLERQCLDPERRKAHETRRAALRAEHESLASVPVDDGPMSETDYEQAVRDLDARAQSRRDAEMHLRTETQHFLREYETRAPILRDEIETLQAARARAVEFEAAITLARDTLAALGQQTHRVWASALQRSASDFLRAMSSDVTEVQFDENLGLQLRQQDRVILGSEAPRVLSAGALDAVFLAARFAVARFLGGDGDPLPLILDDPLANADDRRLVDTLRVLVDAVAPRQQVLLMACQHSRYEWAADALERDGALRRLELESDVPPAS